MCSAENTQKISVLSPQYPYESKTALKTAITNRDHYNTDFIFFHSYFFKCVDTNK